MRVCYFGTYEKNYSRNVIFIKALELSNNEVITINEEVKESDSKRYGNLMGIFFLSFKFIFAYIKLFFKAIRLKNIDVVIFGYPSPMDVIVFAPLFKLKGAKVLFNPLVSLYDTFVIDRKFFNEKTLLAKVLFFIDRMAYAFSDKIFIDTESHGKYLAKLFGINYNKFFVVPVGAMEEFMKNVNVTKNENFTVIYVGKYIPLHGTEVIVETANILKTFNIDFFMVGKGQEFDRIKTIVKNKNINNVRFIEWLDREKLLQEMKRAHVVLGIFRKGGKAERVIPNKVYDALSAGCVVVTARTPAILECFQEDEHVFLVEPENPKDLAEKILWIKSNYDKALLVAEKGKKRFLEIASYDIIGKRIGEALKDLK